jgi:glucose/arabinose dehydrogenase
VRRLVLVLAAALALGGCSSDETAPVETTGRETETTEGETTTGETTTEAARGAPRVRLVRVLGVSAPTHLTAAPGEPDRLYVVEQGGRIVIVERGRVLSRPFLDIVDLVQSGGEQGLLSVAFHPEYEENRLFYVDYTDVNGDTRVVEYRARDGGEPARGRELLFVEQPYANHNGGLLVFGPDGRLYVGMGDGGSAGDPENRAQNLGDRLGKLLSIDVDASGASWRIEGYGLRNPWRFSFDRLTDDLYIADVGQGAWEEIDFLPPRSPGLENYGWDVFEGDHGYEDKEPNPRGKLVSPVFEYSHEGGSCSVTGGFVYRGEDVPDARGHYFYGDYCTGIVWSFAVREGKATDHKRHPFQVEGLSSFGEDARGELYLLSLNGEIALRAGRRPVVRRGT